MAKKWLKIIFPKSPLWSGRYSYLSPKPKLRHLDHPVARKISNGFKLGFHFWWFSYTNPRKRARKGQLRRVISPPPLDIFQFCKKFLDLHNPNFKICSNKENLRLWPGPPCPLNCHQEEHCYNNYEARWPTLNLQFFLDMIMQITKTTWNGEKRLV